MARTRLWLWTMSLLCGRFLWQLLSVRRGRNLSGQEQSFLCRSLYRSRGNIYNERDLHRATKFEKVFHCDLLRMNRFSAIFHSCGRLSEMLCSDWSRTSYASKLDSVDVIVSMLFRSFSDEVARIVKTVNSQANQL